MRRETNALEQLLIVYMIAKEYQADLLMTEPLFNMILKGIYVELVPLLHSIIYSHSLGYHS